MELLRWPGVIGDNASLEDANLTEAVTDLFEEALSELLAHRQREGAQLAEIINERLDEIDRLVGLVKRRTATASHELQTKLSSRVRDLAGQLDAGRLEQEIVLLAQRADVSEELDRLGGKDARRRLFRRGHRRGRRGDVGPAPRGTAGTRAPTRRA